MPDQQSSSISDFIANMRGLARPSRYSINISRFNQEANRRLSMACESVTVPGKIILTSTFRTYGPKVEIPYELAYGNEVTMLFRLHDDMYERLAFEEWMNRVVQDKRHDVGFLHDYAGDAVVTQLDLDDNPIMEYTLVKVFPKSIGETEMGYEKSDQYLVLPVVLSFVELRITGWIDPQGKIADPPRIQ